MDRYYEILGLEPGASAEDVKQAYRDLVKVWHPDRFAHDPKLQQKAQAKLKEINEAYARLRSVWSDLGAGRSASAPPASPPGQEPLRKPPSPRPQETRESEGPEVRREEIVNETESLSGRASTGLPEMWVGFSLAGAMLIVEVVHAIMDPTGTKGDPLIKAIPLVLIPLGGSIYWLFCVYRMHKVIAEATNSTHPITPRQAVGYHFIPAYNLIWLFKWPNQIAEFVNSRSPSKSMAKGWPGFFFLMGLLLGKVVSGGLGLATIFSVGVYLTEKIRGAIESSPSPG